MNRPAPKPLSALQWLFLPLLKLLARGSRRDALNRRILITEQNRDQAKAQRDLVKQLKRESKLYESLLVNCWARLRMAHLARHRDVSTESKGHSGRVAKVQHVKFSHIFAAEQVIFYRIGVNKRTLFGSTKDMLPFGVSVRDLTSDETVFELERACNRIIKASVEDPRNGAWILVHRLEGFDGIPGRVIFRDMLPLMPADMSRGPVILGVGEHKKPHYVDLATLPHWLIGGSTQGGKSNMLNHMICSLMYFSDPEELQFILIDLKRMEFGYYDKAPHLMRPVIFEAEEAVKVLAELVHEVGERTKKMSNKAKELSAWNKKYPQDKMPRIIVIIDEFAELMLASGGDVARKVEQLTARLTNLGRAVGIHAIIATQRPAVQVLPNTIKINMPLIIAARTPNAHQSTVILGSGDAASLPVHPGRMVYLSGSSMNKIQTPYIDDDDVVATVRIACGRAAKFIHLEGIQPVISPEYVIAYIVDCLQGALSAEKLWTFFRQYGVPKDGFKGMLSELHSKRTATAFGRIFNVEKKGNSWRLVEKFPDARPFDLGEMTFDLDLTLARLTAPPQLLMLPAPRPVDPEPETQAAPEPIMAIPDDGPTPDELLDQYIRQCCAVSKKAQCPSKALYIRYQQWCADNGHPAMTIQRFGRSLTDRGFIRIRISSNVKGWKGLEVVVEEQTAAA